MNEKDFTEWISKIYETAEHELVCSEVQDLLPGYVDVQLEEELYHPSSKKIRLHLKQCPDCADEYETLYEVALLEAEGPLPEVSEPFADIHAGSA